MSSEQAARVSGDPVLIAIDMHFYWPDDERLDMDGGLMYYMLRGQEEYSKGNIFKVGNVL